MGLALRYLSLFSGVEAVSVAWGPLGWTPVAFAEIEPFPCSLLEHRFPGVPNLGDVTKITDEQIAALGPIDVVIGGSPCQDLSVAGKRAGLRGERSSLFHEQVRIFHAARHLCGARWLVWENVPGAFTTHAGRDFARVVGDLAGCELPVPDDGWGTEGVALGVNGLCEWAVLDAQFFGVAQRRRRVFAVLDAGDWANRPPVLLEPESLRENPSARGEKRERPSGTLAACARSGGELGIDHELGGLVPEVVPALTSKMANGTGGPAGDECQNLVAFDETQITHRENRTTRFDKSPGLASGARPPTIALSEVADPIAANQARTYTREGTGNFRLSNVALNATRVRRLMPRECERLQGFPDDWTAVPHRGKQAADGPRYRALGNSMAVPVVRWIGRQIERAAA